MKYYEFVLESVKDRRSELVDLIEDLGIETFQEESDDLLEDLARDYKNWNYVDESIFDVEGDQYVLTFYVSEVGNHEEIRRVLEERKKELGFTLRVSLTDDEDWANEWKKYYKPLSVGERLLIVPSWEEVDPKEGDVVVTMDPGMAFGSGTHETTYLCMEKLEQYVQRGDRVFDIGCGSGILSVVASKLGASSVIGVDIDPVAMSASKENAGLNGVTNCDFRLGNLMDVVTEEADLIVSNIIAEIILSFLGDVYKKLVDGGIFISSGIILDRIDLVKEGLRSHGFTILEVEEMGEWASVVARKGGR